MEGKTNKENLPLNIVKLGFISLMSAVKEKNNGENRISNRLTKHPFFDQFINSRSVQPVFTFMLRNAVNIYNYIKYIESKSKDKEYQSILLLKINTHNLFIESPEPYIFMKNCLNFLSNNNTKTYNFSVLKKENSLRKKLENIKKTYGDIKKYYKLNDFEQLLRSLDEFIDIRIRNAIAHSSFEIRNKGKLVLFWPKVPVILIHKDGQTEGVPIVKNFKQVEELYESAYNFLFGFYRSVSEFIKNNLNVYAPLA